MSLVDDLIKSELHNQSYSSLYSHRDRLVPRLGLSRRLDVHTGCVNTISWSEDHHLILSGSDDQTLSIAHAFSGQKKATIHTGHKTNIFSAKFLPRTSNQKIVSCSSGGDIYLSDVDEPVLVNNLHRYQCHGEKTVYEVRAIDPFMFVSCGQDGTCKWVDTRVNEKCDKPYCNEHTLLKLPTGITALAINPLVPYHIVCAGLDGHLRFYDRRMLCVGSAENQSLLYSLKNNSTRGLFAVFSGATSSTNQVTSTLNAKRITSVQYDQTGQLVLASYQPDKIYLLDWRDCRKGGDELAELKKSDEKQPDEVGSNIVNPKIRIHTGWSDTGPDSMPHQNRQQATDSFDPRAFLSRRLNDWFANLAERRTTRTETERNDVSSETPRPQAPQETESGSSSEEEVSETIETDRSEDEVRSRAQSLWFNNSLLSSKIKLKQAVKFESSVISDKPSPSVKQIYTGHRNSRTIIKEANFWGNKYIISGSDCGHIYFWDRETAELVNVLEADKHVVNCVQENSMYPVLASSGIDYNVKIWEPRLEEAVRDQTRIDTLIDRNKMILNENRDTIFIPVQFMLPALRLFGANLRNTSSRSGEAS